MKRFSLFLMLGVLGWLLTVPFELRPGPETAVCFLPFIMLDYFITMLRLYRIRISEGKRGLPGYWELETELWDPMMWRDKILVTVYGAFVFSVYLALLILQKLPAEFAVGFPSLPAFATVTYIMACYPKYQKRGKKALIKGDRADHQSLDCEYDDFDRRGGL